MHSNAIRHSGRNLKYQSWHFPFMRRAAAKGAPLPHFRSDAKSPNMRLDYADSGVGEY